MVEVDTIGNATLILSENGNPLLATDVWLEENPAYFGSWVLSHKVPQQQRDKIKKCKYIFITHFHPDHLNLASLRHFKGATILLAQHYGARMERDLRAAGFTVVKLPSGKWSSLGANIKVMPFNNELQDSALMIEVDDGVCRSLLLNLNDSGGIGFKQSVSRLSSAYEKSIYLGLQGYGDADMINLFDAKGERIEPMAAKKFPVGRDIYAAMRQYHCNFAIPFSSFHQYQRRDSWWANKYTTPLDAYLEGFPSVSDCSLLPAFQKIIFCNGEITFLPINPQENIIDAPVRESDFGDDWSAQLSPRDVEICKRYFTSICTLPRAFRSISLVVGGVNSEVLSGGKGEVDLQFEVPRKSLLRAVSREIFDDLLIGNFMKTTISGSKSLYHPDFTLAVAKYSDNGGARVSEELRDYFGYYRVNRLFSDRLDRRIGILRSAILANIPNRLRLSLKNMFRG